MQTALPVSGKDRAQAKVAVGLEALVAEVAEVAEVAAGVTTVARAAVGRVVVDAVAKLGADHQNVSG